MAGVRARSWLQMWLCLSPCWASWACGGDAEMQMGTPTQPGFAGEWSGETDEGGPVSFVIAPAGLTRMSLGFKLPACEWSTDLGFPEPVALQAGTFESQIEMSAGALRAHVVVSFDTAGRGTGRVGYSLGGADHGGCTGDGQTSFSVQRLPAPASR